MGVEEAGGTTPCFHALVDVIGGREPRARRGAGAEHAPLLD
jgi:hypothetical protein